MGRKWGTRVGAVLLLVGLLGAAPLVARAQTFRLEATLTPPPGSTASYYGLDVALHQDTLVVGDYLAGAGGAGRAYVFERSGTTWMLTATLQPPAVGGEWFGWSVAVWGDTIAVGAMKDATTRGTDAGAVHVFVRNVSGWSHQATLEPSGASVSLFGCGVGIHQDTIIAGPYGGPDVSSPGRVFTFVRTGTAWAQEAMLTRPITGSAYGREVGIWGDTAIVADPLSGAGRVHVYRRTAGAWSLQTSLAPSDPMSGDWFGFQIDISADAIVAISPGSWSAPVGYPARFYVFEPTMTGWVEAARFDVEANTRRISTHGPWANSDGHVFHRGPSGWSRFSTAPYGDIWNDTIANGRQVFRLGTAGILGESCVADVECASGLCVDGVCCDDACGRGGGIRCQACVGGRTGVADGTCAPLLPAIASTTTCRFSAGPCDVEERCSPTSRICPVNRYEPSSVVCWAAAGPCDEAEHCTGTDPLCPSNSVAPATTVCRPSAGACDLEERCNGFSAACPSDTYASSSATCRVAADVCDVEERCSGGSPTCPADAVRASGTVCRGSATVCNLVERCDGVSAACPADALLPDGTPCPDSSLCDGTEVCMAGVCASSTAVDCDDGNPCTADTCRAADGSCQHVPMADCCVTAADCDDGDPCTDDMCGTSGGSCAHTSISPCTPTDGGGTPGDGGASTGDDGGAFPMSDGSVAADDGGAGRDGAVFVRDASVGRDGGFSPSDDAGGCSCGVAGASRRRSAGGIAMVVLLMIAAGRRRRDRGGRALRTVNPPLSKPSSALAARAPVVTSPAAAPR